MSDLVAQYNHSLALYETVTTQFQSMLSLLLAPEPLHIHSIRGRAKAVNSLAGKIERRRNKYQNLSDITDLVGIRIVTYYADEVDKIARLIQSHFTIDRVNSIDKRKELAPDEFGYASLHLIVEIPVNAQGICQGAYEKICKIEVQICSILQHAWAEIEHDLAYKHPGGASDEIHRRFSRLAGLLEMADDEFRSLRDTVQALPAPTAAAPAPANIPVPAAPQPIRGFRRFLLDFPNLGWAAFATLIFFLLMFFIDWYFGTKITHLAMAFSSLFLAG